MAKNMEEFNKIAEIKFCEINNEMDIFKKIELCASIISEYPLENKNTNSLLHNDKISDAWYYMALLIGGYNEIQSDNERGFDILSIADGKSGEWDPNEIPAAKDKNEALRLRFIALENLENAVKYAESSKQKNKCQCILIQHYLFVAKYLLVEIHDLHKSIELYGKIIRQLPEIEINDKTNKLAAEIEHSVNIYDSDDIQKMIVEKYGTIDLAAANNNVRKIRRNIKKKFGKISGFIDDGEDELTFPQPKIEYFYRELLIRIVETLNSLKPRKDAELAKDEKYLYACYLLDKNEQLDVAIIHFIVAEHTSEMKEHIYYNLGLAYLKMAIQTLIYYDKEDGELNKEQLIYFGYSTQARTYFDKLLIGIYDENGKLTEKNIYPKVFFLRSLTQFYETRFIEAEDDIDEYEKFQINTSFDIHYYGEHRYNNSIECLQVISEYIDKIAINKKIAESHKKRGLARAFFGNRDEASIPIFLNMLNNGNKKILEKELTGIQYHKAEQDFLLAIKGNPKDAEAFKNFGLLHNTMAREWKSAIENTSQEKVLFHFKIAIENYLKSIKIKPETETYYYLANCYDQIGSYRKAVKYYKKAINFGNKHKNIFPDIYVNFGNTYSNDKNPQKAIEVNMKALDFINEKKMTGPFLPPLENNLACDYGRIGKFDMAIEHYKKAIAISPMYIDPIGGLASMYERIGDYNAAIYYYSKAIRLSKHSEETYKNWQNREKGKAEEFVVNYYLQIKPQPQHLLSSYLLERACSFYAIGEMDLAITNAHECLDYAKNTMVNNEAYKTKLKLIIEEAEIFLDHCKKGIKFNTYLRGFQNDNF